VRLRLGLEQPSSQLGEPVIGQRVFLAAAGPARRDRQQAGVGKLGQFRVDLALSGRPRVVQGDLEELHQVIAAGRALAQDAKQRVSQAHANPSLCR
jgi:hypothetical protein